LVFHQNQLKLKENRKNATQNDHFCKLATSISFKNHWFFIKINEIEGKIGKMHLRMIV